MDVPVVDIALRFEFETEFATLPLELTLDRFVLPVDMPQDGINSEKARNNTKIDVRINPPSDSKTG
jgi:hypothetical protein